MTTKELVLKLILSLTLIIPIMCCNTKELTNNEYAAIDKLKYEKDSINVTQIHTIYDEKDSTLVQIISNQADTFYIDLRDRGQGYKYPIVLDK